VLDFGLSKTRPTEDDFSLTKTSALMGSPGYMSPEQLRAPRDVGPRSDIWSLGVVLYELVEGMVPFDGETFSELCIKVAMEPPPPLVRAPAGLALVVNRCLEKDADRRFADVAQLAAALVPWGPPGSMDSAARTARLLQGKLRASTVPAPPRPPPYASTLDSASGAMPTQNAPRSHWGAVLAATVTAGAGLVLWLTFGRVAGPLAPPDAAARQPAPAVAPAPVIVPDAAPPPTPPDASPPPADAPMPPRKKPIKRPAATEPDVYDNRN
jgi:eukaryotic-like serine/threonine-protein kinase